MNNNRRRKHIIQLAVLAIFLSFISTTLISLRSLDSLIRHNSQSLTNLLSSSILDAVRNTVLKPYMVARIISGDSFLVNHLRIHQSYSEDYIASRLSTYINGIRKSVDFESAFFVPTAGLHLFGADAKVNQLDPLNNVEDARYDAFISGGKPSIPVIQKDPFHVDRMMFYIFSRIADDEGKVVGMCGVGIPIERLHEILRNYEQQYNVRIHLIDWDGKSMLSTEGTLSSTTITGLPQAFRQNREFAYAENEHGGYTITRYLNEIGCFLVIQGEKVEGKDAFTNLIVSNIVAIVVIFSLLFLAMHFLMHSERTHLEQKAFTDDLTGIVNRAGFEAALTSKLQKDGEKGALFLFDLDHFKEVNDNLGHPAGDDLLKQTAQILKTLVRESDILARLGGDEFVVYFPGMQQNDHVRAKAEKIRKALLKHYDLPGAKTLSVSTSIGIAMYPSNGNTYTMLYKNADKALYTSKEGGRNRFTIFHE